MVKEKGPADASDYTRYKRQLANLNLQRSDNVQNVPMYERKSIISRSPFVDAVSRSYMSRFAKTGKRDFISSFGNISIIHGRSVIYGGYSTGIAGAGSLVLFNNNILFVSGINSPNRDVIVRVPLDGTQANLAYDQNNTPRSIVVYNNQIYVSFNPNVIRRATLNPDNTLTMTDFATITGNSDTRAIAFDSSGNMYAQGFTLGNTWRVSKILPNGTVEADWNTTGITNAQPTQATCVFVNGVEYLYVVETLNVDALSTLKRIRLDNPSSVELVAGGLHYADAPFSGNNINPVGASLGVPRSVMSDSYGNIYISSDNHARYFMIDVETGLIRTILGNGSASEDPPVGGIPGTSAQTGSTRGFAIDERRKIMYFIAGDGVIRAMPYFVDTKDSGNYI